MNPSYEELTQRHQGIFSDEEQEKIRRLVVVVAGCGALGAPAAHFLARLGVGTLRLADPEEFEPSNVNRQFGAYLDTMGLNKAEAVASELRRINPDLVVQTYPRGVEPATVGELLDGAAVVVDGIDFFALETELLLHRESRRRGLWVVASQGVVEITTVTCFDPGDSALESMVCDGQGQPSIQRAIRSFVPVMPRAATPELIAAAVQGELPAVPADVTGSAFGAAFLVEEILRIAVREQPPHVAAPDLYVLNQDDLWLRVWRASTQTLAETGPDRSTCAPDCR